MASTRRVSALRIATLLAVFCVGIYLINTSRLARALGEGPILLAHRALGQDYDREGLTGTTCTAARMIPSPHRFLENTLPSMEAAFAFGADIVEFDVHRTTDGHFAVFHDWTLDCRTDGSGVTRNHTLAELQGLDVGYGYTSDDGATWPFRGESVGLMPSLTQVLTTFPDRDFLVDIKSNDPSEGRLLAERLAALSPGRTGRIMVYGGTRPVNALRERLPTVQSITRPRLKKCLLRYAALGWTGYVPSACGNGVITVPANAAPWLWGWPNRFVLRMAAKGSQVLLIGDYSGEGFSQGFDDPARARKLPHNYSGGIWTDRIDLVGPAMRNR